MSDFDFEIIDECDVIVSRRASGKKKLSKWTPLLSWERETTVGDEFYNRRDYGQPTEQDFEEISEQRNESLRKQNQIIDELIVVRGIRIKNIKAVRNQKEVRIKL